MNDFSWNKGVPDLEMSLAEITVDTINHRS